MIDTSNIPNSFWHSVSASLLIVTVGLTIAAFRAESMSIDLSNRKIDISNAISDLSNRKIKVANAITETDQVGAELEMRAKELERKAQDLNALQEELEAKIAKLEQQTTEVEEGRRPVFKPAELRFSDDAKTKLKTLAVPEDAFKTYDKRLDSVRESLTTHKPWLQQAVH